MSATGENNDYTAANDIAAERKKLKEELLLLLAEEDAQKSMCRALLTKAINGDIKAFEVIREIIGEKQAEKSETSDGVMSYSDYLDKCKGGEM